MRKNLFIMLFSLVAVVVAANLVVADAAETIAANPVVLSITKSASASQTDGGNVNFTLAVKNESRCDQVINSMLVFDRSASMGYDGDNPPQPITDAKEAVYQFTQALDFTRHKAGLLVYNDKPELVTSPTNDPGSITSPLINIQPKGHTNIADSITMAAGQLQGLSNPVMILFTDGYANRPEPESTAAEAAITAASSAKAQGIRIVAIGLGNGADLQTLRALASSPEDFHFAPTTNELKDIFLSLAKSFLGTSPSTVIRDDLTAMLAGFDFVSASDGGIFAGNSLSWNLGDLQCGETRQVTFTMQPRLCGTNPGDYPNSAVVTNGIGSSNNSNQTQVKLLLPNLTISVTDNASLAKVGQQLDFVVHVANTGDGNSGVFTAEYLAPEGLEILPNSISAGGVLTAGGKVAWQLQLAPGEEQDLTLSTIVKDSVADGYSDMVSIARLSTGCGSIESSDRTQAFKEVTPDPDYTLRVDCVNYREGKIEAFFGYQNNLSDLQPLDESELSPANADGHAPKVLRSGNYEQAFSASASSEVITWSTSVAGESQAVTADRNSPACPATPATPQMPSYPPTDIVIGGPKVDVPASQSPNFPPAVLISGSTKLALCNTRTFTIDDCSLSDSDGVITAAQFSLNGGRSWYPVKEITGLGTSGASCRIDTPSLADGTYELRVRALDNNGNFGTDVVTDFVVDCEGIVIGSTQFNQRGLLSPINDRGRVQSFTDTDLYMAIAIAGGPDKVEVHAEKEDTDQVFELTYNSQLELWEGNLFFADPGVYNLRVLATEASGQATSRYTNSVEVISGARVLDVDAGVVAGADVWVYYRPDQNSNWRLWNGGVFGVHQPLDSTQVEVVLEPGQYYLQIEHPDYFTTTTREFTVSEYSILNSQLRLYRKGDVLNWLNSISQPVTVMPITEQLITGLQSMIGERLPEISISGKTRTLNTDDLLAENKPFVLVTWTDWGTISAAQWQNISDLFTEENARLLGESSVYPVGLLEGEEEDSGVKARGDYEFPVYKPVDLGFYDILHIISAPQYFFVDAHGIVKDIRVGTMKIGEVSNILKEINTLPEVAESN